MGQDPEVIRREIEETRERMGDTVDALGYKADVKSRAKESVTDKVDSLKSKVVGAKDSVTESVVGAKDNVTGTVGGATGRVSEATPSGQDVKRNAKRAVGMAQENPLGLAIGSLAVGFLAGLLLPHTRIEDEKLGSVSDSVIEKVKETGQEALEHGKQVAGEAAQAAKETAQEKGQEHAQELQGSAQQSASSVREEVRR